MAIGAIISVISGAINIFNFASENLPLAHSDKSTVRIYAALASSETNAGGDIPKVFTYNERGDYMGESSRSSFDIFFGINDKVETGSFVDVEVPIDTDNVGQQATYALFKAGNDAVCVAYAAITWPDGTNYAWSGDWGKACGATWYWSNIYMDGSDNNNLDNTCIWIDADGNQPQTGFQIHWPEFVAQEGDEDLDPNYFCNDREPTFRYFVDEPEPEKYFSWWILDEKDKRGATSKPNIRNQSKGKSLRSAKRPRNETTSWQTDSRGRFTDRLILDDAPKGHSAVELCNSETSHGPDFANIDEGVFCSMADKTLYPICNSEVVGDCFNLESQQLVIGGVAARSPYKKVEGWGGVGKKLKI